MSQTAQPNNKVSKKNVFRIAGAIIAALIGSGFATGEEVLQFFMSYGQKGIIGTVVALVLFSLISGILVNYGYKNKTKHISSVYSHYLGSLFGRVMQWYTPVFAFLIGIVTISGAGATIKQYFGLENIWGTIIMSAIVLVTMLLGFDKLIDVISVLGPLTVLSTIFVSVYTFVTNPGDYNASFEYLKNAENLPFGAGDSSSWWWLGAFLFVAYNIVAGVPFITRLGQTANSQKEGIIGGVVGGTGLMLSAFFLNLAMLGHAEEMLAVEIPVLQLSQNIGPVVGFFFVFILLQEIFTTSAPFLWTVTDAILPVNTTNRKRNITMTVISLVTLVGAQLPFRTLVGIVYPFSGYFGSAMIFAFIIKDGVDYFRKKNITAA